MINNQQIVEFISAMGYKPSSNNSDYYIKRYMCGYEICVDFKKEQICYIDTKSSEQIILGDTTTSNFKNSENFVVLECVNRLLEKGYAPNSIVLENKWGLGHKEKGKLDILVLKDAHAYLMIECKTWGNEFDKEESRMYKNGGQLFTYFNQDKNAEYLCLYTSHFNNGSIEYKSDIVKITDELRQLANVEEIFNRWNKQFFYNGIFENDILPYMIQAKALLKKDLQEIKIDDSKKIYNQFLEILRHNVVSDKPNAFNKIFNLFVCKVYDEDNTTDDEELSFQWKEGIDTYEIFIDRLNILYKKGMDNYLKKNIFYISLEEIDKTSIEQIREQLKTAMIYKNQEFSFIEIFDKKDFERNTAIIKEVVELLQNYRFRYTHKHQFLGDFFENLLNTGFKQEAGQFFTPRILTRFIVSSLPIQEFIEKKLISKESDFIPKVIDFACGSGHFLTESMDIIQKSLMEIENKKLSLLPRINDILNRYNQSMDKFIWAKENIYGIENDYRLVKTAKLSCFFNGDGEANIIQASGIAPFDIDEYRGTLLDSKDKDKCEKFDILISNPPYSVDGFKSVMNRKDSEAAFKLYNSLTDTSKEIEVIFIERMKQLVKPNGYAAIILPVSILQNDGLYAKARTIIFENFELKAVLKLGSGTFQATGTNTVCMFLQKRESSIKLENKENYKNMCKDKTLLVCDTGEKDEEKSFLGYSFSSRRGNEGITETRDDKGNYLGKLLNENNIDDNSKANYYILKAFRGEYPVIPNDLANHIYTIPLEDSFNFSSDNFTNRVSLVKKKIIKSKYNLTTLQDIISYFDSGIVYSNEDVDNTSSLKTSNIILTADNIDLDKGLDLKPNKYIYLKENIVLSEDKLLKKNDIFICLNSGSKNHVGKVAFILTDLGMYAGGFTGIIRANDKVIPKFLYYILKTIQKKDNFIYTGSNINNIKDLTDIKVPIPTIYEQSEIIKEIEKYEIIIAEQEKQIKEAENQIKNIKFSGYNTEYKLSDSSKFSVAIGKRVLKKNIKDDGQYPIYSANVFKPFGYTNSLLFDEFGKPSVLWGIDGDWMTNYIQKNIPFYPTDHCGVLRCLDGSVNIIYLSYALYEAGKEFNFSRHIRASIDRIKNLTISVPDISEQNKIGDLILTYRDTIMKANHEIQNAQHNINNILNDIIEIE
ncbi:MAG: N-6 DNA methylase [Mucispirillum sp.]|nr:N-6 DNA methylase [Mucispirillum sp.]